MEILHVQQTPRGCLCCFPKDRFERQSLPTVHRCCFCTCYHHTGRAWWGCVGAAEIPPRLLLSVSVKTSTKGQRAEGGKPKRHISTVLFTPLISHRKHGAGGERQGLECSHISQGSCVSQSRGCGSEGTAANRTRWSVPCLWARASPPPPPHTVISSFVPTLRKQKSHF